MPKLDYTAAKQLPVKTSGRYAIIYSTQDLLNVIDKSVPLATDGHGNLFFYENGVYQEKGEDIVRDLYVETLRFNKIIDDYKNHTANEVVSLALRSRPTLADKPPLDRINLLNGIYDVKEGKLVDHNSDQLSSIQIPINYDKDATCPAWDSFLHSMLPGLEYYTHQLLGLLLIPYTKLQVGILFVGEGSNGKSTLTQAIQAFIGKMNVSNVSLHSLENNRFAASRLVGKLANICDDLPTKNTGQSEFIKTLISGESLYVERKGRDSFQCFPFARMIFCANKMPKSDDGSYGYNRRWQVVPCNKTFKVDPGKGRELEEMLSSPSELSGVLNKALITIPHTLSKGLDLTEDIVAIIDRTIPMPDCVRWFFDTKIKVDEKGWIPSNFLFKYFRRVIWEEFGLDSDIEDGIPKKIELVTWVRTRFTNVVVNKPLWFVEHNTSHKVYHGISLTNEAFTKYSDYAEWVRVEDEKMAPDLEGILDS
jgi:P4 family phage/plasmid primase-like protien